MAIDFFPTFLLTIFYLNAFINSFRNYSKFTKTYFTQFLPIQVLYVINNHRNDVKTWESFLHFILFSLTSFVAYASVYFNAADKHLINAIYIITQLLMFICLGATT